MIAVKQLSKQFGNNVVLRNITIDFHEGVNNLIIGSSGSGKTTLLKCIIGLHAPSEGEVWFNGQNFGQMTTHEKTNVRKEIGMLFQNSALFDSMNVEENLLFPLNMFTDWDHKKKQNRVAFCLERVNLVGSNKLRISELSGGMKKRVGIARAIVLQPKYLFCDEPNSGLDPQTAILIDELINEITSEYRTTTIVVTHDMNSVMNIGNRILFLYQGRAHWQGSNHEVIQTTNNEVKNFVFAGKFLRHFLTQPK